MPFRPLWFRLGMAVSLAAGMARAQGAASGPAHVVNPAFAYELDDRTPEEQAELLAANRFDGAVFDGANGLARRLTALDARHLQLFYLWLTVDVGNGTAVYEPGMESAIRSLAGRSTVIWLAVKGGGAAAETRAVAAVRHVADAAAAANLRVALYPHFGFYLARFSDVVRVAEAAQRSNVGVTFNVCHELRAGWPADLDGLLARALPRLYGVTINGAERNGRDWPALIQPLGHGDFDAAGFVERVVQAGYRGPIGIQCYGLKGDPASYLAGDRRFWDGIADPVER